MKIKDAMKSERHVMRNKLQSCRMKYFNTYHDRTITITASSFMINQLIGISKLLLGIYYSSIWFMILGIYYMVLCLARGQLVWEAVKMKGASPAWQTKRQMQMYRKSGGLIFLAGIVYFILCIWMYCYNEKTVYPDYILYGVAAVSFYKIISACIGLFTVSGMASPLLSAVKTLSVLDGCVSIVAVQCALLTMKQSAAASSSSAILGMGVSCLFLFTGMYMRRKKSAA